MGCRPLLQCLQADSASYPPWDGTMSIVLVAEWYYSQYSVMVDVDNCRLTEVDSQLKVCWVGTEGRWSLDTGQDSLDDLSWTLSQWHSYDDSNVNIAVAISISISISVLAAYNFHMLNIFFLVSHFITPRCVRPSVCPSVDPSVSPSGTAVHCDHAVHFKTDLSLRLNSPMFLAPWHVPKHYVYTPSRLSPILPGREMECGCAN